jgi:acyl-CoA synthetase (AMP-forming)/AMP-acid ligase II
MRRPALENVLAELAPDLIVASSSLEVEGGLDVLRQSRPPRSAVAVVGEAAPGLMSLQDLLGEEAALAEPTAPVVPQDLLAVLYTSGTTGRPKGVMHSHRSLISPVVASIRLREIWSTPFPAPARLGRWARVLMRYGTRLLSAASRPQVMLSTMPLHTISGLEAMLQALLMGDTLVLLPRFHPVRVLEAIERERVTVLIGTPLMYQTLMAVRGFERYRLSSLLICAAGAAPCPPTLAREIQRRFRCAVHIGFGMTELGGGIAAPSLEDSPGHQAETVGRAMPGMEILVVDEARRPVPPGTVGELACRSDSVMLGYFGETTDTSAPVDEEGWLYTGDLAVMDEQGYLRIVGRKKDMIIRGGQNVYPVRLEQFLGAIPGVREAAVVGVPDPLLGESVWAFVVPSPESVMSEADLFERCRAGLEAHEVPQEIRLLPDFPRTSSGKPRKPELRELALREREIHEPVAETQTHL